MVYSYLTGLSSEWLELGREDGLGFNVLHLLVFSSVLIIGLNYGYEEKDLKSLGICHSKSKLLLKVEV